MAFPQNFKIPQVFTAAFYSCLQVHFQRSVKRVSDKVNKGSSTKAYKAFTTIAYAIPTAKTKTEVESIFQVLCGAKPLSAAISNLPESSILKEYEPEHDMESWKPCSHWCDWWMRPNHLSKITSHFFYSNTNMFSL